MMNCTRPVIVSTKTIGGTVDSGIGAFVIINREGWALTAAHIIAPFIHLQEDLLRRKKVDEHNSKSNEKKEYDPNWLDKQSFWLSWDSVSYESLIIYKELDLALFKLTNFNPKWIREYPVFKDPSTMKVGMSICRIGFPFTKALTSYVEKTESFVLNNGILPIPFFPNDGIYTRLLNYGTTTSDNIDVTFLETSSPGFRGQSGGPIFDKNGYIVGIQSNTVHLSLGFKQKLPDGTEIPEQYLNVGRGAHVKSILEILDLNKIRYYSESDNDGYRIVE